MSHDVVWVTSGDGVDVALHRIAGEGGGTPLLISHATGFHARCYAPMAAALANRFESWGIDHRGHGHTPTRSDSRADWQLFGQDALAVARRVAPDGGLVGFGHSMGGAALLMAARTEPDRFERLVLYEPIAMPLRIDPDAMDDVPIVQGARRRRRTFDSFDEAVHNYRSKPPMSLMTREVLHEYVDHGFRRRDDGTIELRCTPEYEAAVFIGARSNGVWEILPDIAVPTVVVAGRVGTDEPSEWAAQIADRLPFGTVLDLPHLTHFGPFSHPTEIAAIVDDH